MSVPIYRHINPSSTVRKITCVGAMHGLPVGGGAGIEEFEQNPSFFP